MEAEKPKNPDSSPVAEKKPAVITIPHLPSEDT